MKKVLLSALLICGSAISYAQTPTDSLGIWAIQDGKPERMIRLNSNGMKVTGGALSGLTFGATKVKAKAEFKGETSPVVFDGPAKFLFYFGDVPEGKIESLGMFSNGYSVRDFEIGRFQLKKGKRLLTTGSSSIWGSSSIGAGTTQGIETKMTTLGNDIYELEVKAEPGEYCIYCNLNGMGIYSGVYDFTIKESSEK